jgi:hypothetical protein
MGDYVVMMLKDYDKMTGKKKKTRHKEKANKWGTLASHSGNQCSRPAG